MAVTDTLTIDTAERLARIARLSAALSMAGFGAFVPALRLIAGANPRVELPLLWRGLGVPLVAILLFLLAWGAVAPPSP